MSHHFEEAMLAVSLLLQLNNQNIDKNFLQGTDLFVKFLFLWRTFIIANAVPRQLFKKFGTNLIVQQSLNACLYLVKLVRLIAAQECVKMSLNGQFYTLKFRKWKLTYLDLV